MRPLAPPRGRFAAGCLGAGRTVTGLCVALCLVACRDDVTLVDHLSADEANSIRRVLAEADIDASLVRAAEGDVSLRVGTGDARRARRMLDERGLPRPRFDSLRDVFKGDSMVTSPFEERARFLYATSQGLEETLRNIDGVLYAKVHIVMPEARSLVHDAVPPSASVYVKYHADSQVPALSLGIQRLVANAVPGLTPARVVVMQTEAPRLHQAWSGAQGSAPPSAHERARVEGMPLAAAAGLIVLALVSAGVLVGRGRAWIGHRLGQLCEHVRLRAGRLKARRG